MIKQDLDVLERDLKAQNMAEDDIKKQLSTRRAELKRDVKKRARGEFWCKVFKLKKLRRGRRDLDFAGHVRPTASASAFCSAASTTAPFRG